MISCHRLKIAGWPQIVTHIYSNDVNTPFKDTSNRFYYSTKVWGALDFVWENLRFHHNLAILALYLKSIDTVRESILNSWESCLCRVVSYKIAKFYTYNSENSVNIHRPLRPRDKPAKTKPTSDCKISQLLFSTSFYWQYLAIRNIYYPSYFTDLKVLFSTTQLPGLAFIPNWKRYWK